MSRSTSVKVQDRTADKGGSVSFFPGQDAAERHFRKMLFFISIGALLLRGTAAFEMACAGNGINNMLTPQTTSDLATYIRLGKEISSGKLPEVFYYQPFYYAVFLPVLRWVSGPFYMVAVIAVQTLLSSASCYLAGMCAEKIFSRRAGVITCLCCAISSPLILYVPYHQNETLHTYLLTLLFFLILRAVEKGRWRDWCFTGLTAGVAILNRGNIALLLPLLLAVCVFSERKNARSWKSGSGKAALILACAVAVQLPFIIYNSVALKRLSGPSTAADAVLALGNTVEAPAGGRDPGLPAGAMYYPEAYRRTMDRTLGRYGKSVPAQMWEFFCDEPLAFLELQFRKALLFWDGREIPNNVSLRHDGGTSRILRWLLPGRSTVLLTLGLAGLFWFLPELKRRHPLKLITGYGFVFFFWVAVTAFYMLSRFRAPVLPVIFVFAGGFVDDVVRQMQECAAEKRRILVGKIVLVTLCAFGFVFSFYDGYRIYFEPGVNRFLRPDGIQLDLNGADIHVFDHGPAPFGGWTQTAAKPGMVMEKKFARCSFEAGMLYFCVSNTDPVRMELLVNGYPRVLELPPLQPGKSPRKNTGFPVMLADGGVRIEIVSCQGDADFIFDTQRDYGRSALNGKVIPGEWVFRFGKAR